LHLSAVEFIPFYGTTLRYLFFHLNILTHLYFFESYLSRTFLFSKRHNISCKNVLDNFYYGLLFIEINKNNYCIAFKFTTNQMMFC